MSTGSEFTRSVDAATARYQALSEEAEKMAANYGDRSGKHRTRLTVLTWMVGINIVITLSVLWRLLTH